MFEGETGENQTIGGQFDTLKGMPPFDEHMAEKNAERDVDPEKLENFNKLVRFLDNDMKIKENLMDMAPTDEDLTVSGEPGYIDDFYADFEEISDSLNSIMEDYYPSEVFDKKLKDLQEKVIENSGSAEKLASLYRKEFTPISEEFVEDVHKNVFGYQIAYDPHSLDEKVGTVNEMLHLMHSAIMNSEGTMHKLPVLEKSEKESIVLYGVEGIENDVAKKIYEDLASEETNGFEFATDIVALKDRILMMARDRGHALTMDVQKDKDGKTYVNYFVPKICNAKKVNLLPGVRKVPETAKAGDSTTGVFSIESGEDVAQRLKEFLDIVPTDDDLERS